MVKVDLSRTTQTWRGAFHVELRAEAASLASRGWPVLAGTHPEAVSNRSTANGQVVPWQEPVPAQDNWLELVERNALEPVSAWRPPYSLLVATGIALDAVEVSGDLGRKVARLLRALGEPAPIIAMPNDRWLFLTDVADFVPAELSADSSIVWHAAGSWIPVPPTPFRSGVVHWRVKPEVCGWQLPKASALQEILIHAREDTAVLVGVGASAM
jgi:hypothetical protein